MDSDGPTYAEMEKRLDEYYRSADLSAFSPAAQAFMAETYCVLKQLMKDFKEMQDRYEGKSD